MAGGIGENEFEIGFPTLGGACVTRLELGVDGGVDGDLPGLFFDGGDGDRAHGEEVDGGIELMKSGGFDSLGSFCALAENCVDFW